MKKLLTLSLLLVLAAGCGKKGGGKVLVMISKGVHPYYEPCFEGFKAAAEAHGVKAEYHAPSDYELPKQVKVIEDLMARQVDGMAISALDDEGLIPVIADATKAGIKVITFDAPAPSTAALSYIGTANEAAGYQAGLALAALMKGKGEVAVMQGGMAAPNLNLRYKGFERALKEKGPGMKIVAREDTLGKLDVCINKAESLLEAHPKVQAIFGISAEVAPGAAAVVQERKLSGKVLVAGFDDLPETLDHIRKGTISFALAQKTYLMGWLSVEKLLAAIDGKAIEKDIDTGVVVITKDNVDTYQADMRKQAGAVPSAK